MRLPQKPKNNLNVTARATRQKPLFSSIEVTALVFGLLFFLIMVQEVGLYLFAQLLLSNKEKFTAVELITLGSDNGTVVSLSILLTMIAIVLAVIGIVSYKIHKSTPYYEKRPRESEQLSGHSSVVSQSVKEFLAIKSFKWQPALKIFMLFVLYSVISEVILQLLDKNPSDFIDSLYASAEPKWLLIIVVVIVVPIYEEIMFRGIIWSALRQLLAGKRGVWLASIVTSILFTLIHLQYDLYGMGLILVLALLFSLARIWTGSLLLPILLHMLNNALAMVFYVLSLTVL